MKEMMVIVKKDLKETVRNKIFILSMAVVIFLVYYMLNNMKNTIVALLKTNTNVNPNILIQPIIGITLFILALMTASYFSLMINSYTLLIEKTKHSLESLLCTPLSLKKFWFGKTMSMFIPSIIIGF